MPIDDLLDSGLRMLITSMVDNAGLTRAKTVPAARVRTAARDGIGLSPVFALMCTDDAITTSPLVNGPVGDNRLMPDLDAAAPLGPDRTVFWAPADQLSQDHEPVGICQRSALRRQEARAVAAGLEVKLGFELEFTVFSGSREEPAVATLGPAYGVLATLELETFADDVLAALEVAGVPAEQFHPEYAQGQVEVALPPASPLQAADQSQLARLVIHRVARQHGLMVSFAPITVAGFVGNGAHIHFSATVDGESFDGLSEPARHLMAGIVRELDGLTGVLAPSVLSADRRKPSSWAGAYACWGVENREAAVRYVPGSVTGRPGSANCEIKIGDPSGNVYLSAAAVLAAAVNGLEHELTLWPGYDRDPSTYPEREQPPRLPLTVEDALVAFERSAVLRSALGDEIVEPFLAVRRHDAATLGVLSLEERVRALRWRY
ncbi:glutamine synthetase family protein [Kribbella sp. NPDC026611]|uniref:glutamine synthetase family protein n=1 Tax=Kribbella sp. NPDC026611 TaxID=3154911 RepID=UPI003410D5A8